MKKLTRREKENIARRMGITSRKSLEERGSFPRPAIFEDKKKKSRKYAARRPIR